MFNNYSFTMAVVIINVRKILIILTIYVISLISIRFYS